MTDSNNQVVDQEVIDQEAQNAEMHDDPVADVNAAQDNSADATEAQQQQDEQADSKEPTKKGGKSFEKRIGKLVAEREVADDRAADAEARATAAETALSEERTKLEQAYKKLEYYNSQELPAEDKTAPKPRREDYADPDAYDEALIEWAADKFAAKSRRNMERDTRDREYMSAQQQVLDSWNAQMDRARKEYDDFDVKVGNPSNPFNAQMANTMLSLPNGADVAYYLATNSSEARRISQLGARHASFEIWQIARDLANQPKTQGKPPVTSSKAPPPHKPMRSTGSPPSKNPEDMSMAEYRKWREGKPR